MTPEEMKAYITEQLATIASQRQEAQQQLTQTQHELTGLNFAQQAYQDMLDQLNRHSTQPDEPTEEPTP
jgi:F0F1-type ATP synthase membrane subunit b/b'